MGSFDFEAEEGLSESMGYARVRQSERWVREGEHADAAPAPCDNNNK